MKGPQAALHKLNPVRIGYLRNLLCAHFPDGDKPRRRNAEKPLAGLKIVDCGCGGGLLAEPLAKLGANVTAIDPADENINVARRHAELGGLEIDYRPVTVESLAAAEERFDVVLAMEVLEHVADVDSFLSSAASPGPPRRPVRRRDAQPHAEKLCAGDRRRRICFAMGRAGYPRLEKIFAPRRDRTSAGESWPSRNRPLGNGL